MPELDKNYIAGLYLDEITLDVMPQEYIDAALEVKLRYDACAPRAGYNCVQDRRVKGGFYYRKAPQGQGVNALPPSKLERALARSQEQPTQRSGLSFLSKAAIGAGVAIGGLALTGAVVNAGRSSEPYQDPVRQKPDPVKTHFNATTIGLAGVAASSVGAAVIGLSKKTEPQKTEETIKPEESAKAETPKTPEEAQKKEGADAAGYDIAAIKEMTSSPISSSAIAYENALAIKYSKEGGLAQGREKASLYAPEGDENFVRLSDVQYSAEKKEPTKASRAKTSADLQKTYDKLKEYGLEDSIEFRKARSKARGKEGTELNTVSANPYSITRDGVTENVGEMRFMRSPKDIQKAIAEKLKSPAKPKVQPSKSPSSADLPMYSGSQGQKIAIPEGANFTGWKLHLNFGNGGENVTQEAYDKLTALGVPFKVGKSGSQTGKDATVYVGDPKKAKAIAAELSQLKGLKPLKGTDAEGTDIELAPGIGARFNVGAGNPEFQQYGRKGGVDLVDDVQNRIFDPNKNKGEAEINAGLQKDWENGDKALRAKFGDLYAGMMDSPKTGKPVKPSSVPQTTKEGAIAYLGQNMVSLGRGSADGYVNQSAILGDRVLGAQLGGNKALDLVAEGIAEGRIQKKVVGRNTYIRDIEATPFDKLISEAKGLTDVKDLSKDSRVQDLRDAATYKEGRAKEADKPKAAELQAAIAGIQEVKAGDRGSGRQPKINNPENEGVEEGGVKNTRGASKVSEKARLEALKKSSVEETPVAQPTQEEVAARNLAEQQEKQTEKRKADQRKREAGVALAQERLTEKASELAIKKQLKQIDGDEFNAQVEKLRQSPVTARAVENAITPIRNEYDDRIAETSSEVKKKSLEREKAIRIEEQTLETYKDLQIPDPVQVKPPAKENPTPPPTTPPVTPAPKAASEANAAAVNTNKPAGSGKRSAIAEGLNLTAEDEARYASISGSTVSAGTLKGNEMLGKINTRMSFLQDQKKADRIEALLDKANKGEFVSQSDIDAVSIDFDGNYSPSDLKSEQAKSDISRAVSRLRLSEDVGEKPERRAKRMLLEAAERLTSYLSSPQNYSAFKAGTKDDLNTVDYMSSQEKSQLESLIKNTFNASAIAAYKRGENYSNKDLQRVYKDLTGERLSFTAAQKKAADKAEQVNDAIAPSEEYLSAYYETRNKYRRAS